MSVVWSMKLFKADANKDLAGFGIGIGSGRRSCGYGRYHVDGIK